MHHFLGSKCDFMYHRHFVQIIVTFRYQHFRNKYFMQLHDSSSKETDDGDRVATDS